MKLLKILLAFSIFGILAWQYPKIKSFKFVPTAQAIGDLSVDWGVSPGKPIFTISNIAPGDGPVSRTVTVSNGATSNRTVAVKGLVTTSNILSDKLNINIYSGPTLVYGPKTLSQFFADSNTVTNNGVAFATLPASTSKTYKFDVSLDPSADNPYQNKSVVFDIKIGISVDVPEACRTIQFAGQPIFGTSRGENITGTPGNDLIVAMEGNDKVESGNGNDCILGGPGDDRLTGNNGNDVIVGEIGNDDAEGNNGSDTCDAETEKHCEN
jgi:Ca2+-binding RTX toxin-like protein